MLTALAGSKYVVSLLVVLLSVVAWCLFNLKYWDVPLFDSSVQLLSSSGVAEESKGMYSATVHSLKRAVGFFSAASFSRAATAVKTMGEEWKDATSVYDFSVKTIDGEEVSLEKYRGHVLLIVNVASKCGLTPTNYQELVELDEKYKESKGLRILAFPCNQFAGQEPGSNEEIVCFMKKKNALFDTFDKINVNGNDAHPLWKYLKQKQGGFLGSAIKWNFTKFIVDKNGQPVERHGPNVNPSSLVKHLEKYW